MFRHALYGMLLGCVVWAPLRARGEPAFEYVFSAPEGSQITGVTLADDGSVYTVFSAGGAYNLGCVTRRSPDGAVHVLHSFNGADGAQPKAALTFGRDAALYGTTSSGGRYGYGSVFRLSTAGAFSTLRDLELQDGGPPRGPLLLAADGGFYGVTFGVYRIVREEGYDNWFRPLQLGAVYHISQTGDFTVLYDRLIEPSGGVIQASDGWLYGLVSRVSGGNHYEDVAWGDVYRMKPDGSQIVFGYGTRYIELDPRGELVEGSDGFLYGVDGGSAGSHIFKFLLGTEFDLQSQMIANDSSLGLAFGTDGRLYGAGRAYFRLPVDGSLTYFRAYGGEGPPTAALEADGHGGFILGNGDSLQRMTQSGSKRELHSFGYANGMQLDRLSFARDGALIGVTRLAGTNRSGAVFQLAPDQTATTLAALPAAPYVGWYSSVLVGSLTEGMDGDFYGITRTEQSAIVRISRTSGISTLRVLDAGAQPGSVYAPGPLIQGVNGKLYGAMTTRIWLPEGSYERTARFYAYEPTADELSIMATLSDREVGQLLGAADGTMYFLAWQSETSAQELMSLTAAGTLSKLHTFGVGDDSYTPIGNLAEGEDGAIYGLARPVGGAPSIVVFRWDAASGVQTYCGFVPLPALDYANISIGAGNYFYGRRGSSFSSENTPGDFVITPDCELRTFEDESLGMIVDAAGQVYRAHAITRDGYAGFVLRRVTLP
jgi:uncharacterized repeat protein (TIGR03803 family)